METHPKHPKFVRWALMLGIIVILNIFFTVLVSLALPAPQYNDYCTNAILEATPPATAASCDSAGGMWTDNGAIAPATDTAANQPTGYCDLSYTCGNQYATASNQHDLYAFIFMIGLGIIALLAGIVPTGSSIVSTGLSYGGVITLILGSAEYWNTAGQWLRFAIALIGLAALLYVGWKRFKD